MYIVYDIFCPCLACVCTCFFFLENFNRGTETCSKNDPEVFIHFIQVNDKATPCRVIFVGFLLRTVLELSLNAFAHTQNAEVVHHDKDKS